MHRPYWLQIKNKMSKQNAALIKITTLFLEYQFDVNMATLYN